MLHYQAKPESKDDYAGWGGPELVGEEFSKTTQTSLKYMYKDEIVLKRFDCDEGCGWGDPYSGDHGKYLGRVGDGGRYGDSDEVVEDRWAHLGGVERDYVEITEEEYRSHVR